LWHSGIDFSPRGAFTIHDYTLGAGSEKIMDPVPDGPIDTIMKQFAEETFMWDQMEGLGEIKYS